MAQNRSEESVASKPLNKKQQKVATAAKKEAAKAAFAAKKALQMDTTLDRLLNDTIPEAEDDDSSDESFAPVEPSDNESEEDDDDQEEEQKEVVEPVVPTKQPIKKRKNEEAFPEPSLSKSKAKQPQPKVNPKAKLTKKQKLNESSDSLNSSSASSSSISTPSSPDTPKPKKTKKPLVKAPSTIPDSPPVIAKSKKIANAGIQKRSHKSAIGSSTSDKNAKKVGASKEQLEKTAAKLCHKVSAAEIKKKAKGARR